MALTELEITLIVVGSIILCLFICLWVWYSKKHKTQQTKNTKSKYASKYNVKEYTYNI
jgi:hypothetical protein